MISIVFKIIRKIKTQYQALCKKLFLLQYKSLYKGRLMVKEDFCYGKNFDIFFDLSTSKVTIGKNVEFRSFCEIRSGKDSKLTIGDSVFFNNFCTIHCFCEIEIGSNNQFGESVKFFDVNHNYRDTEKNISEQGWNGSKISIGNNCWFGSGVTILKGVTIGDNVVVGAHCLIYKSIPSNSIVIKNEIHTISTYR